MKKTIYIYRHGETRFNKEGIIQGSGVDSSLNATGKKQAQAFYDCYKEEAFEVLLTSKLIRTHETSAPFREMGLPWEQYEEINEMNWGEHEGQKATPEMRDNYLRMVAAWSQGDFNVGIKGGETAAELGTRISVFVEELKKRKEEKILVCSHGRAIRCLIAVMKGKDLTYMEQVNHHNTGLYLAHFEDGKFHFELENDTRHLVTDKK